MEQDQNLSLGQHSKPPLCEFPVANRHNEDKIILNDPTDAFSLGLYPRQLKPANPFYSF